MVLRRRSVSTPLLSSSLSSPPTPAPPYTVLTRTEPFTLTLSGNNHRNLVVYGPDFLPIYHVETRWHETSKTDITIVFKQDDVGGQQIYPIACLEFHASANDYREDMIIYDDTRQPVARYFPRKSDTRCVSYHLILAVLHAMIMS